jgi:hypothetical protein
MLAHAPSAAELDLDEPIQAVVAELLAAWPGHRISLDQSWIHIAAPASQGREQGWKLHVSATPLSAPEVLRRAAPLLLEAAVGFKAARTTLQLGLLNQGHSGARSQVGKFLTIYPRDDEQAVELARALDAATAGLDGPAIPSDQPLRPGSLVHYRFGGFRQRTAITSGGMLTPMLVDPDGRLVPDRRDPWFSAPEWAVDPFERAGLVVRERPRPGPIGTRYRVRKALQQTAKGGVYLADDRSVAPPRPVVIKEGRRAVTTDHSGRDARARIDHEHALLRRLSPAPYVPEVYDRFEQEGNHFLVLELLEGQSLRSWLAPRGLRGEQLSSDEIRELAGQLFAILEWAHGAGVVLRDFNPNKIRCDPAGNLRLIDLEISHASDDPQPAFPGWTRAFAREQAGQPGSVPAPEDDYFSLGATLFFIATLVNPILADDGRERQPRLAELLDQLRPDLPGPLRTIILDLLATDAGAPADLAELRRRLDAPSLPVERPRPGPADLAAADLRALAVGLGDWILETARPEHPAHCWAPAATAASMLPISIQHGAAGVGLFLLDLYRATGEQRFLAGADMALDWSLGWMERNPELAAIPGLYFGAGGPAWLALSLVRHSGNLRDRQRASQLLARIDGMECPHLDLAHGLAGIGWLHLLAAQTLDAAHTERVRAIAESLAARASPFHGGLGWEVMLGAQPDIYYGYSHGAAGIGAFLLEAAALTGSAASAAAAQGAAQALFDAPVAVRGGAGWSWPHSKNKPTVWPHFCNGAAGIGLFLARLYAASGAEPARAAAERAAEAAFHGCQGAAAGLCHGVAGEGLFLLELHQASGSERALDQARALARLLLARAHRRDGRTLWEDDSAQTITADLMTGNAGVGAFLLRLSQPGLLEHPVSLPLRRLAAERA